jgi:transposase-like protein
MTHKRKAADELRGTAGGDELARFACPNEDCCDFNRFGAGNVSVCERMGKDQRIRRLYCKSCGCRFSERRGSLLAGSKLPEETVVRIVKCLGHGCSIEATADICEVDPRTVELLLSKAGPRADDFHRLQLEKLTEPIEAVEVDELHGALAGSKKGAGVGQLAAAIEDMVARAGRGFTWLWR